MHDDPYPARDLREFRDYRQVLADRQATAAVAPRDQQAEGARGSQHGHDLLVRYALAVLDFRGQRVEFGPDRAEQAVPQTLIGRLVKPGLGHPAPFP
jgi:hypothetical protein